MLVVLFLVIVLSIAIGAGFIGALAGLGGGLVVGPALVVLFHVTAVNAIGLTAISALGTSIATGASPSLSRLTDLRIGTALQTISVPGAMMGVSLAIFVVRAGLSPFLLIALGIVLLALVPGALAKRNVEVPENVVPDGLSRRLNFRGTYYDLRQGRDVEYVAGRTRSSLGIFLSAGFLSGLLGIGSGGLNVLGLEREMQLPMKVATATSNFMMGTTVAVSAGVLLIAGYITPLVATIVGIGTMLGAYVGAYALPRLTNRSVRLVFIPILFVLGVELILRGLGYA